MTDTPESTNGDATGGEATGADLVTCHAIIGHPNKAKFLVVRHNDGWAPPTVRFPPGSISYAAPMITDGISRKYGLRTRMLRSLFAMGKYHCIELELVGKTGRRKLDAVWAGREEHARYSTISDQRVDPFAQWLDEKARDRKRGGPHPLRAPWAFPGWFDSAVHWIDHQLNGLGIQATGTVEQWHLGWNMSCVLRVPTSQGDLYFKASYARPPREAELLSELARSFPGSVPAPLAVDTGRNWMLTRSYRESGRLPRDPEVFPRFARLLGEMQVASSGELDRWRSLGCPVNDLEYLDAFLGDPERWESRLFEGGGRLQPDEAQQFVEVLGNQRHACRKLAALGVPNALVHPDFRPDNFGAVDSREIITDWADTVIGHPFLALDSVFRAHAGTVTGNGQATAGVRVDPETLDTIIRAYLEPFAGLLPEPVLREAMKLARSLCRTWAFSRIVEDLDWVEPGSQRYVNRVVQLQREARQLLTEGAGTSGGPG